MTSLVTRAHLSGPLGQALAVIDGKTWLFENGARRAPAPNDIQLFFDHGVEVVDLGTSFPTEEELHGRLVLEQTRFLALHRQLMGMDRELDEALRRRALRSSNRFLKDSEVLEFMERRFLRPAPSHAWDIDGAIRLCRDERLQDAERLYAIVRGPVLQTIDDNILAWTLRQGATSLEHHEYVTQAYDSGLVAELAAGVHDRDQPRIRKIFFSSAGTAEERLLRAHLVKVMSAPTPEREQGLVASNPSSEHASGGTPVDRIKALIAAAQETSDGPPQNSTKSAEEALKSVLKQIRWIGNQFISGHIDRAWHDLEVFAERDLKGRNTDRLAMSLTNIATRRGVGEEDAHVLADLAFLAAPHDSAAGAAKADLFRKAGRLHEALAEYDRVVEAFPGDAIPRNGRAETLYALGRFDEALAYYDNTIDGFEDNEVAQNGRAKVLRGMGRLEEALTAYDDTIRNFPQGVYARNGRAETLRAMERFEDALIAYEEVIQDFPKDVYSRNGRADILREVERLEEALAAYDEIIRDFPEDEVCRNGRAEALRAMGRLDDALALYDDTIRLFRLDHVARNGRAGILRAMGRLDEALAAYDRTVADFPRDEITQNARAEILRAMGRFDEAHTAYEQILKVFPPNVYALAGRAETLRAMGRLDDALAAYDQAAKIFPQQGVIRHGRAEILRAMGRFDAALAAYDECLITAPRSIYARTGRAETLRSMGRLNEAYVYLDETTRLLPHAKFVQVSKAVVLSELGRLNEARTILAEISEDPKEESQWVAAHVLCMIDLRQGNYTSSTDRLMTLSETCPYKEIAKYFHTTLASAQLAAGRASAAKQTLDTMLQSEQFDVEERSALLLMEAHAEAIQGNEDAAKQLLASSTNVFPYKQFALLRLKQELERRFGLADAPALREVSAVQAANSNIANLATEFWIGRMKGAKPNLALAA